MAGTGAGYEKDLFILPFDHRGSFESGLLGVSGAAVPPEGVAQLSGYKRIIYDGFLEAVEGGISTETSAILVDQQYGSEILADAHQRGVTACTCMEKSGQDEFDFEYGGSFLEKLLEAETAFGKVLVRYNPRGEAELNRRQRDRLKQASEAVHSAGLKFMFELIVAATPEQLESVGGEARAFDTQLRPGLMAEAIAQLQDDGIEPDVWKLEGINDLGSFDGVARQVRAGGRDKAGIIILGRGENAGQVDQWLTIAAQVPAVIGFAVGRTTFWEPIVKHKNGEISRADAVSAICGNYSRIHRLFAEARTGAATGR